MPSLHQEVINSVRSFGENGGRNLVFCCDGTGNIWKPGPDKTNVAKLFEVLEKSNDQITYYDPGVGTPDGALSGDEGGGIPYRETLRRLGVWRGATVFGRMSLRLIPSCCATTSMATVSSCSGSLAVLLPPVPFPGSSTCSACYGKSTKI